MELNFAGYIRNKRKLCGITLREAAKQLSVKAPYLSRIETGRDRPPSAEILKRMADVYKISFDEIVLKASEVVKNREMEAFGVQAAENPAIYALFKMVRALDEEKVREIVKDACTKYELNEQDFLTALEKFKARSQKLPRLQKGDEGLFAADVKPRRLSKFSVESMAYSFFKKHGFTKENYFPPTPIEKLIDHEEGINLIFDDSLEMFGDEPYELGMSHWSRHEDDMREIHINDALNSERKTDIHRLRFTAGHELFHCLEHLMLMDEKQRSIDSFQRTLKEFVRHSHNRQDCRGKRYVDKWLKKQNLPRRLSDNEAWREWQADYFSACVLMPSWSVKEIFKNRMKADKIIVTEEDLRTRALELTKTNEHEGVLFPESLNDLYQVSAQAMAIRLLQLNLVAVK